MRNIGVCSRVGCAMDKQAHYFPCTIPQLLVQILYVFQFQGSISTTGGRHSILDNPRKHPPSTVVNVSRARLPSTYFYTRRFERNGRSSKSRLRRIQLRCSAINKKCDLKRPEPTVAARMSSNHPRGSHISPVIPQQAKTA